MTRRRIAIATLGSLAALVPIALAAGILVLRSAWFNQYVRGRIAAVVEKATGGRTEIGTLRIHWAGLRAEVDGFVLHGTEPAGKPPLLRAGRVSAGLKIVSLARRGVNLDSLIVERPQVYLIVAPGGRTNVPGPKVKSTARRGTMETILDLQIGRVTITDGAFEIETRGRKPFSLDGRKLQTKFLYDAAASRYSGEIAMNPLDLRYANLAPLLLDIKLALGIERDRIHLNSAVVRTGGTELKAAGGLDSIANPHGSFQYELRAGLADLQHALKSPATLAGTVHVAGNAVYRGGSGLQATGTLRGEGLEYHLRTTHIRHGQAAGAVKATPGAVEVSGMQIAAVYSDRIATVPGTARIHTVTLRGSGLDARGVVASALGGTFRGDAQLADFDRLRANGSLAGFDIRRIAAIYTQDQLPWNGLVSGGVHLEANLKGHTETRAGGRLAVSPAASGEPVHGELAVEYDTRQNRLDVARSYLALPHSRLDLSGSIGHQVQVRLESRDLRDILPAVGAGHVPVKIESGAVLFAGAVTGSIGDPRIAGHLATGRIGYGGVTADSVAADVTVSPSSLTARGVQLARGAMRVEAQADLALTNWKPGGQNAIFGTATVRDGSVADLLSVAGRKDIAATGTVAATAQVSGTVDKPLVAGELSVTRGSVEGEPFDSLTARLNHGNRVAKVSGMQLKAGGRQLDLDGEFQHAANTADQGRLSFRARSTVMALDQFRTLQKARPGIKGTLAFSAAGAVDLVPPRSGQDRFRLVELQAEIRGRDLALTGQPLGDVRLIFASEGQVLRARLASDYAKSRIRGTGQWQLTGDYPGSATVTFTRLDFEELRAWLAPESSLRIAGSAEGELRIDGPARKPELVKATLSIPKLEVRPSSDSAFAGDSAALLLRNRDPIVATLANRAITVESAHFVGRSTDLKLAGKVHLQQKNPLDLRVNGRIDLAILQDLDRNVYSAGMVNTDATIRGPFGSPQVSGRLECKDASLSLADVPNGISHANGVILFTGDRATIQTLTGESGGGTIRLTGFAGYGGSEMVFRLHARAQEVRVRYPEGVSTVANANLFLTGTSARSMLSGTVTVLRTGFNPQSDFSSILAKSAEPVRTPSARTGFLSGLNFDVQIATSPGLTVQSSLAEGVQVESNLRLRGTASNPALQGRINVTRGQIVFFGTKYTINQGSVAFYNAVKIEPVLNVDLETKARGVEVTLTVSGPLSHLSLTPRSDPPLQFSEIVALLATGRTPTSDPSLIQQQANSSQSWQQMGASALLGQAIANPVAGRLQRFFGVSKLKIDPSLAGVENSPQARLTLEQQITQNLTFTYITNVTTSNPQVIRVEWAFNRNWSAVAVREENGLFGLDFYYKKRFK